MSIFNAYLLQALITKESSYVFRHMLSIDMIIVWTINDKEIECQNKSRILSFLDMRINLTTYMIYRIRCFFYIPFTGLVLIQRKCTIIMLFVLMAFQQRKG